MSQDQQRLFDYLQHILEAINRIHRYTEEIDEISFLNNQLIQDAVIRNLEIIGEASRNIYRHYPEYVEQHTNVPFSIAYEMRNVLAHGYFRLNLTPKKINRKKLLQVKAAIDPGRLALASCLTVDGAGNLSICSLGSGM